MVGLSGDVSHLSKTALLKQHSTHKHAPPAAGPLMPPPFTPHRHYPASHARAGLWLRRAGRPSRTGAPLRSSW